MKTEDEIRLEAFELIKQAFSSDGIDLSPQTPLIGDASTIDSMRLVELCLELEDLAADMGFAFDWTSEAALSKSRSIFRTIETLLDHFLAQKKAV